MGLQADNRTQIEATEYNQDYTRRVFGLSPFSRIGMLE